MRMHTTQTRNRALERLRNVNRGVALGAVVLTALFAEAAAKAFPGKKTASRTVRRHAQSTAPLAAPSQNPEGTAETAPESTESATPESTPETGESATPEGAEAAPQEETAPPTEEAPVTSGGS